MIMPLAAVYSYVDHHNTFIFTFMLLRFIIEMNIMLNVKRIQHHLWWGYSLFLSYFVGEWVTEGFIGVLIVLEGLIFMHYSEVSK